MRTHRTVALCLWCMGVALAACAGSGPSRPGGLAAGLSELTPRERRDLELLSRKLPAPCHETPMTVEQCTRDKVRCPGCVAASRMLLKAVRDGRSRPQIEAVYLARFEPIEPKPIDLSDAPILGDPSAPVTVVEFADFQCPACSSMVGLLDGLVRDFGGYVKLSFKHFPLSYHAAAELSARAAVAAQRQGRFWELHHKMFQNQRALSAQDIDQYAREIGLDMERFRADLASPETAAKVKRDHAEGNRIGVNGTPTIFIDGRQFSAQLFDTSSDLSDWVQAQIELKTGVFVEPGAAPAASVSARPATSDSPVLPSPGKGP